MDKQLFNSEPIYLGYEKSKNRYYFYAIKDGAPRFLSFVSYFFWDKGPESALILKPVPEEIETELRYFLQDRIEYEFFKQRKNSREKSVKKAYKTAEPATGKLPDIPEPDASSSPNPDSDGRPDATTNPTRSRASRSTVPGGEASPDAPQRRRKVSRASPTNVEEVPAKPVKPVKQRRTADVEIQLDDSPIQVITRFEREPEVKAPMKKMKVPDIVTEPDEASAEKQWRGRRTKKEGTGKPNETKPITIETGSSGKEKGPVENEIPERKRRKRSSPN